VIDAIKEIGDLHILVYDAITKAQKDELIAAMEKLQAQRAALQEAYEAQRNKPAMLESLKLVADSGKHLAAAYAGMVSANLFGWLEAGGEFDAGIRELGDVLTANRAPPNTPDFLQLNKAIGEARAALDAFVALVHKTREEIIGSQKEKLRTLIESRDRLEQYRTIARFGFGNLIRGSIQEYLQTSDANTLKSNLALIKASFDEKKVPSPLNLTHLRELCFGNPAPTAFANLKDKSGCVEFSRGEHPYAVVSRSKRAPEFPLLLVAPGNGTVIQSLENASEPPRDCRRLFCLGHAATAVSAIMA
jgi:hypothetical protein